MGKIKKKIVVEKHINLKSTISNGRDEHYGNYREKSNIVTFDSNVDIIRYLLLMFMS